MVETALAPGIGRVRKTNQDFVQVYESQKNIKMVVVCDEVGGHQGGDVASTMAASHLGHGFAKTDFVTAEMAEKQLQVRLKLENETILHAVGRFPDLNGMRTTVVLAICFESNALIAHSGDSRAYLYSREKFTQLTENHSLVNELVKLGQIVKEQARNHPQRNIVTQTLSVSSAINPEFSHSIIQKNDIILLCTDGLTNSLEDDQIHQILATKSLSLNDRYKKLVTETNRLGGGDSITVCLLSYKADDKE